MRGCSNALHFERRTTRGLKSNVIRRLVNVGVELLKPFMTKMQWQLSEYKAYATAQAELAIAKHDFAAPRSSIKLLKQFLNGDGRINHMEARIAMAELLDQALMTRRRA